MEIWIQIIARYDHMTNITLDLHQHFLFIPAVNREHRGGQVMDD
jgi:hypothetical protein